MSSVGVVNYSPRLNLEEKSLETGIVSEAEASKTDSVVAETALRVLSTQISAVATSVQALQTFIRKVEDSDTEHILELQEDNKNLRERCSVLESKLEEFKTTAAVRERALSQELEHCKEDLIHIRSHVDTHLVPYINQSRTRTDDEIAKVQSSAKRAYDRWLKTPTEKKLKEMIEESVAQFEASINALKEQQGTMAALADRAIKQAIVSQEKAEEADISSVVAKSLARAGKEEAERLKASVEETKKQAIAANQAAAAASAAARAQSERLQREIQEAEGYASMQAKMAFMRSDLAAWRAQGF
ncbi:MAG: hypothetical protein P4L16_04425 [Chlamydiales bacterium]|nr:hypothetical protein [Chlamydiales bacterium]